AVREPRDRVFQVGGPGCDVQSQRPVDYRRCRDGLRFQPGRQRRCFRGGSPAGGGGAAVKTAEARKFFGAESPPAPPIMGFSMLVLGVTAVIFIVVATLLVYSIVKFRATPANADREPAQVYGSTQIELAWTIIPILIVVVLFAATARVIHAIQDAPKPPSAV